MVAISGCGSTPSRPCCCRTTGADPLNQAADRASVCLFLRGDMEPAKHSVGISMAEDDLVGDMPRQTGVAPGWHALALLSRDGKPIAESKRLLITHLTDLQNSGARFSEQAGQTLLAWGKLPHLVLNGRATVKINAAAAGSAEVWALATSGKRLARVEATPQEGALRVPVSVAGTEGARMMYEVVLR